MPYKSYNAEEIEQKLIHQIQNNSTLNSMMDESTPPNSGNSNKKNSSLYMDEIELGGEYNAASAPPAITVLNMDGKGAHDLDDRKSNKHGRYYRNMAVPIVSFVLGVVFVAAILTIVVVSTGKKNQVANPEWVSNTETIETQLTTPSTPATAPEPSKHNSSKQQPQDDFIVLMDENDFYEDESDDEDDYFYEEEPDDEYEDAEDDFNVYEDEDVTTDDFNDYEDFDFEGDVCDPRIKFHQELFPQSTPIIASDGDTIAVKHGSKLNFYEQDQTQSYVYLSLPQTHERSVNSNELEDFTFALDGSTSIMGDYMRDEETGAVFVIRDNREDERPTTQFIAAPDDVSDGGRFGYSVDIYKDRLIVGAPFGYDEGSGSAYVYAETDEGTWELEYIFPPPEEDGPEDDFELFGESVAIHKNRAAVSGYNEFDEVTVFIYEYSPLSDSWEEIDDIIVDKNCQTCSGVGVDISFRYDGGLFISYPRKNEISYLVPTSFENGGEYALVQKIYVDEDGDVDMDQVEVGGEIMVVGVTDDEDTNLVYVYSQSDDTDKWEKVDEIELPPNKDFDPDEDFIDLALSRSNLIVNYGDAKLIWYTLEGCE